MSVTLFIFFPQVNSLSHDFSSGSTELASMLSMDVLWKISVAWEESQQPD